jgi:hypothetical protein
MSDVCVEQEILWRKGTFPPTFCISSKFDHSLWSSNSHSARRGAGNLLPSCVGEITKRKIPDTKRDLSASVLNLCPICSKSDFLGLSDEII